MNESTFWQILEAAGGDAAAIETALESLSPEDIDAWHALYWQRHNALHRWDVWGAADVINGGCSDDSFHYFKAWAIGKGRAFYDALLADPDSIGPMVTDDDLENGCENELLNYAADQVYGSKGLGGLPGRSNEGKEPSGEPFDDDDLTVRYPKLWEQFADA